MGLSFEECRKILSLSPYPRPEPYRTQAEKTEACDALLKFLLRERGMIAAFSAPYEKKRTLVRRYMNLRAPLPVPEEIAAVQDRLFWTETLERGIVKTEELPANEYGISLWQGDITRLNADAIVNAANRAMLGCFLPGHNCIDNAIHSYAGMQLRGDCSKIISAQGCEDECGDAKLTLAYNLPCKYVLHTAGPMVGSEVSERDRAALRSCYTSCLNLAEEAGLRSVAFCCVSTGVFNFPRAEAAEIAVGAAMNWRLKHGSGKMKIIFDTYLNEDTEIYRNILKLI
ncbi:MAG: protein-ADP-ribose hydrolase [Clostridia bacterium]|nr:protein-ADP-ribose hydrolase [Clostridia bacterium]